MGIANVVQKSISQTSESVWTSVGNKLPQIPIETSKYDKAFVSMMMLVGLYTSVKLTCKGINTIGKSLIKNSPPPKKYFLEKYGQGSWALIANVARNQTMAVYLAEMGINLIMMGDEQDIKIVSNMVDAKAPSCRRKSIPVNWEDKNFNYNMLLQELKDYDISFLMLPKMPAIGPQASFGTHIQQVPVFQHYYLLVRHFGPLLRHRQYKSAIILPSYPDVDVLKKGNGITQGVISGLDSFMRCLNYEFGDTLEAICARGSVQNCFAELGKSNVSY